MVVVDDKVVPFRPTLLNTVSPLQFTHTKDGPIIETTLAENFVIKRFLTFMLADIEYQMLIISRSNLPNTRKGEELYSGGMIVEYIKILLEEVERGIQETQIRNETPPPSA